VGRYADGLLSDGERVILRSRQHWLAPALEARWALAVLGGSVVLLWAALNDVLAGLTRPGFFVLLVTGLGWLGFVYLGWASQDYLVTSRRVLKVEGILAKHSADSSLEKINDAVLSQSVLGRILGYGDLEILTASEVSVDHYSRLRDAPGFKRTMLDAKHRLEDEAASPPGPPVRTRPADPGTPAMPMGQGSAGPRHMSAAEITAALRDLADLRDRGAISTDDFEAKKRELLARL
jgi:hypothetical protein